MKPEVSKQRIDLIDAIAMMKSTIDRYQTNIKTLERAIMVIENKNCLIEDSGERLLSCTVFEVMRELIKQNN